MTAPKWSYLHLVEASNYYARVKSNYTFNFTLSEEMPNELDEGIIFLNYPD